MRPRLATLRRLAVRGSVAALTSSSASASASMPLRAVATPAQAKARAPSKWRLLTGACELPHPQKRMTGGEDAYFVDEHTVGVADGVGGWALKGIDAGEYSRTLMSLTHAAFKTRQHAEGEELQPLEALTQAHRKVTCPGSSTACVVQLCDGELHAINVGDSGFLHFRLLPDAMEDGNCTDKWRVVYKSTHQCHSFNCPYQLGFRNGDAPETGEIIKRAVLEDDLILLGTDGLFDNLFPEQIENLLDTLMPSTAQSDARSMRKVASCIANTAHRVAKDACTVTPFAQAARRAGHEFDGGKMDDITVVASLVVRS